MPLVLPDPCLQSQGRQGCCRGGVAYGMGAWSAVRGRGRGAYAPPLFPDVILLRPPFPSRRGGPRPLSAAAMSLWLGKLRPAAAAAARGRPGSAVLPAVSGAGAGRGGSCALCGCHGRCGLRKGSPWGAPTAGMAAAGGLWWWRRFGLRRSGIAAPGGPCLWGWFCCGGAREEGTFPSFRFKVKT